MLLPWRHGQGPGKYGAWDPQPAQPSTWCGAGCATASGVSPVRTDRVVDLDAEELGVADPPRLKTDVDRANTRREYQCQRQRCADSP